MALSILHFDDARVDAIQSGAAPMTNDEREFLVTDTPHFEECQHSEAALRAMSDSDLMQTAFYAWSEYASGQV